MAETERFMRGPQPRTLVEIPCVTTIGIEKGDFVLLWRGNAINPAALGFIYSSAPTARREARMIFGGVARNTSPVGSTTKVQIDVSLESIFALDQCSAHAASVADLYGICAVSNAAGAWGLEDQKVEPDCSYPIAVNVQEKLALETRILAKLLPGKLFNVHHSYNICENESHLSYA